MQKENLITIVNENGELSKREFPFSFFSILSVSNNGHIAAASDNDIIIIPPSEDYSPKAVQSLSKENLEREDASITQIFMDSQARYICAGISQKIMSTSDKIQAFFMLSGKKHKIRNLISFIEIETGKRTDYFEHITYADQNTKFQWAISYDFTWLATAEPMKDGTIKISSAKIKNSELFKEEILPQGSFIKKLKINELGTIAVEFEDEYGTHIKIIPVHDEVTKIEMKPSWLFIHLGKDFIVIKNDVPEIIIKTFDNYTKYYASFRTLQDENIPWSVHFFEKENASILTVENGKLEITKTSLNQLSIDAKKWTFLANRREQEKTEQESKKTLQEKKDEHYQKKKAFLAMKLASFQKKVEEPKISINKEDPTTFQEKKAEHFKNKHDMLSKHLVAIQNKDNIVQEDRTKSLETSETQETSETKQKFAAPLTLIPDIKAQKIKLYSENGEELNSNETREEARERRLAAARRKIIMP